MTVDEAFALAARLDLGECDSRDDLVARLRERRAGVIADLIAMASWHPDGSLPELEAARRAELALVEEALTNLNEVFEVAP